MKHGGDLSEASRLHGGSVADWLDLSTGINPWSWAVPADLPATVWQRLPSRDDKDALIGVARAAYRVPDAATIVAAPGTQALIQWLPRLAGPGAVAIVTPTYEEHARSWAAAGRAIIELSEIERPPDSVSHVVVVNPNSPDGRITARASLVQAAEQLQPRGGWLMIDESFADFDPGLGAAELCVDLPVVILRSFGKFFGLAGMRLGFAIAAPPIADRIADALGPWAVSGPALAIGCAALRDVRWADEMRPRLAAQAAALDAVLVAAGFTIVGGTPLYRLVRHARAAEIHDALAKQHIWTRRFERAPDLLRFGLPPDQTGLDRLATALATEK